MTGLQHFTDPVNATGGRLVPFSGHGFVVMVCSEVGFHRKLASSDFNQSGVIGGHGGIDNRGPKLCFLVSFVYLTWPDCLNFSLSLGREKKGSGKV